MVIKWSHGDWKLKSLTFPHVFSYSKALESPITYKRNNIWNSYSLSSSQVHLPKSYWLETVQMSIMSLPMASKMIFPLSICYILVALPLCCLSQITLNLFEQNTLLTLLKQWGKHYVLVSIILLWIPIHHTFFT